MKRNIAVILACMLSLSACGSGANTQQAAAPAASETVQAETAAAETSRQSRKKNSGKAVEMIDIFRLRW